MSQRKSTSPFTELRALLHAEFETLLTQEFLETCGKDDNLLWFLSILKQESLRIVKNRHRIADEDDERNPLRHLTRYE